MITRRRALSLACCSSIASAMPGLLQSAKSQPQRGVSRILVGFPAGGNGDFIARLLASEIKGFSPTILVENRPGAGGRLALDGLKASAADGSTMILTPAAMIVLYPHIYKTLKYDAFADFIPVTKICDFPYLVTIGPMVSARVKTLADFIAWCRSNPGQATYGTPGAGTPLHFTGVSLARAAGFDFVHVPYLGSLPAAQGALGGQIASAILPIDVPLPYLQSGQLRAVVSTSPQRATVLPDVPTVKEEGFPSLEFVDWMGIFLPAGTPDGTIDSLDRAIRSVLKKDETKAALAKMSYEIAKASRGDFARLIRSDFERWGSIVQASDFTPQD